MKKDLKNVLNDAAMEAVNGGVNLGEVDRVVKADPQMGVVLDEVERVAKADPQMGVKVDEVERIVKAYPQMGVNLGEANYIPEPVKSKK